MVLDMEHTIMTDGQKGEVMRDRKRERERERERDLVTILSNNSLH